MKFRTLGGDFRRQGKTRAPSAGKQSLCLKEPDAAFLSTVLPEAVRYLLRGFRGDNGHPALGIANENLLRLFKKI